MSDRLSIQKTHKLYIGGAFVRSESGRSLPTDEGGAAAHLCLASRKDLRNAIEAAAGARAKWSGATAYLRGQILYRMAEMLEGKRAEMASACTGEKEVDATIDRLVGYAGWSDKYQQVLGVANPVAGPYHNFTVPMPTGVVGVVAPDAPPLLGLVSLLAPVVCSGNTAVVIASEPNPVSACVLSEVIATSDVPAGVINVLTGERTELLPHLASHREVSAIHAAAEGEERALLRAGAAENLKRVRIVDTSGDGWFDAACESPWWIEPFIEPKTIWHPSAV